MKTYPSYEAAKINNPEEAIYVFDYGGLREFCSMLQISASQYSPSQRGFKLCNPSNHCVTVERFLADGHKFVSGKGDAYLDCNGVVRFIGDYGYSHYDCSDIGNIHRPKYAYILSAAALEDKQEKPFLQTGEEFEHTKTLNFIYERLVNVHSENPSFDYMHKLKNAIVMVEDRESPCNQAAALEDKPKRTKVSYEKCEDEFAWQLVKEFEKGVEFYTCSKGLHASKDIGNLLSVWCDGDLHRRIETEITERDEFIEVAESVNVKVVFPSYKEMAASLYDSGKFKLVEGE